MATYNTGMVEEGRGFKPFPEGTVGRRKQTFTVTTALAADDVIKMIPVYAGEEVIDLELISADLDTNGSPAIVLAVGDSVDEDRYIAGSTIGQAGGRAVKGAGISGKPNFPYVYAANDNLQVKVTTGPGTGATSVDITLVATIV